MTLSFGKKYWLSFCQSYGYFAAVRKYGREQEELVMYQFNDASTGIPHFCYQDSLEILVKEAPSSEEESAVLKKIEENKQKQKTLVNEELEAGQLDFFNMLDDND